MILKSTDISVGEANIRISIRKEAIAKNHVAKKMIEAGIDIENVTGNEIHDNHDIITLIYSYIRLSLLYLLI